MRKIRSFLAVMALFFCFSLLFGSAHSAFAYSRPSNANTYRYYDDYDDDYDDYDDLDDYYDRYDDDDDDYYDDDD